jgi:hypothetical protein
MVPLGLNNFDGFLTHCGSRLAMVTDLWGLTWFAKHAVAEEKTMKIINLLTIAAFAAFTVNSAAHAAANSTNDTNSGAKPIQISTAQGVVLRGNVESDDFVTPDDFTQVNYAFAHSRESLHRDMLRFRTPVPASELY